MKKFCLILPKEYILFPHNEHFTCDYPLMIWVNYKIVFGEHIEIETLEIPFRVTEMLNLGNALNNFITDAAFNNYESEKLKEEKPNFDQRLKNFVDAIDDKDDLKNIL